MPRETYATMNSSFFGDMLASIAERGRALLDRTRDHGGGQAARSENLADLCEELLSGRGEASGVALAGANDERVIGLHGVDGSRHITASVAAKPTANGKKSCRRP